MIDNEIAIFNKVVIKGELILDKEFSENYPIKKIKAVHFKDDLPEEYSIDEWNNFVERTRSAIGVDYYTIWVRSKKDYKVIGIMAFFDKDGKEIKEKHFGEKNWKRLCNKILKLPRIIKNIL